MVWTLTFAAFEVGGRMLVRDCEDCWGRLLGLGLPPYRLLSPDAFVPTDRSVPFRDLVVDGKAITRGDLWGIMREDALLGYAPAESATSVNGWWQSNNVGARRRTDTERTIPDGRRRWLIFGDSYTNGSRLPQENTWPYLLERSAPEIEAVNLGVDGYGIAQSYLRYGLTADRLEHDGVLLTFVPTADLARDINTLRVLMGWRCPAVMPRFVLAGDGVELIRSPFSSVDESRRENHPVPGPRLTEHLERYDSHYFRTKYESPRVIGGLVTYKLLARLWFTRAHRLMRDGRMRSDSEAVLVTRGILARMHRDVTATGRPFLVLVLPMGGDVERARADEGFMRTWREMSAAVCPPGASCTDLLDDFLALPSAEIDSAHGSHFGPHANAALARMVLGRIEALSP